jgi:hypothetical protein
VKPLLLSRLLTLVSCCGALAVVAPVAIDCKGPVSPGAVDGGTPTPVVVTEDIHVTVDGVCETITAITPDATVQLVCATAEEVSQIAVWIAQAFGVALDGGALKCIGVQGQGFCATPAQMQKAIQKINAQRATKAGADR